jgi:hypothetical protein
VGTKTVLRLTRPVAESLVTRVAAEFGDVLGAGGAVAARALPPEANEPEIAHLPRLVLDFDRLSYGRLRQLIDLLNREA